MNRTTLPAFLSIASLVAVSCAEGTLNADDVEPTGGIEDATDTSSETDEEEESSSGEPEGDDGEQTDPPEYPELAFPGKTGTPKSLFVETASGPSEIKYELIEGHGILEGDIVLYEPGETPTGLFGQGQGAAGNSPSGLTSDAYQKGAIRTDLGTQWPAGVVPYVIADDLPHPERAEQAMVHWAANTGFGSCLAPTNRTSFTGLMGQDAPRMSVEREENRTSGWRRVALSDPRSMKSGTQSGCGTSTRAPTEMVP